MFLGNKNKKDQRDMFIAYKQTFGSEQGKKVLFDLMDKNFILNPTKGDPSKEGRREAILDILYSCNISIEKLDSLMKGE